MGASLTVIPEIHTAVNAAFLHSMLDSAEVVGVEAEDFRTGNLRLIQLSDTDTPITPPLIASCTAPTLGGTSISLAVPEIYSFSGSGRDSRVFGWHTYGREYTVTSDQYPMGKIVRLGKETDLRDGSVSSPFYGTIEFYGEIGIHPRLPCAILDETAITAGDFYRLTLFGLTKALVRNPESGHTLCPGMPVYWTATGGTVLPFLLVADCSAYSIPAGRLCGELLGFSVDVTEALLPINFWPFGLYRIPATGWSAYGT